MLSMGETGHRLTMSGIMHASAILVDLPIKSQGWFRRTWDPTPTTNEIGTAGENPLG